LQQDIDEKGRVIYSILLETEPKTRRGKRNSYLSLMLTLTKQKHSRNCDGEVSKSKTGEDSLAPPGNDDKGLNSESGETEIEGRKKSEHREEQQVQQVEEESLDELDSKINSLLAQRSGLISELKRLEKKRTDLRGEIRSFTSKIDEERKNLESYFSQLKKFRGTRKEILARIREIRTKSSEVEKVLSMFEKEAPRDEEGVAMREKLRKIDRTIQTERLTRQEERQLLAYAKELEVKLHLWKKAYSARQELTGLLNEIRKLKLELDKLNETGTKTKTGVEERHDHLDAMVLARGQLFDEMRSVNSDAEELDSKIENIDSNISGLRSEKKRILDSRRKREQEKERAKTSLILESARGVAKQKLDGGQKLTFDELKLIFGEDQPEG
jgi:uncharacterized coiled-coil DUF342 family protein